MIDGLKLSEINIDLAKYTKNFLKTKKLTIVFDPQETLGSHHQSRLKKEIIQLGSVGHVILFLHWSEETKQAYVEKYGIEKAENDLQFNRNVFFHKFWGQTT